MSSGQLSWLPDFSSRLGLLAYLAGAISGEEICQMKRLRLIGPSQRFSSDSISPKFLPAVGCPIELITVGEH